MLIGGKKGGNEGGGMFGAASESEDDMDGLLGDAGGEQAQEDILDSGI